MKRTALDYVEDILQALEAIERFVRGQDEAAFRQDQKTVFAVVRAFEIIGEAANKIPTPIQEQCPDIPWVLMITMRNKLIHEYFGVDTAVLWKTIQEDLPPLKDPLTRLFQQMQSPSE